MTIDQWLFPPLSDSVTPSILARADLLVTKTAFLAGMAAPETAACLSKLLMVYEAQYSRIIEGHHTEPGVQKDALKSADKYSTLRNTPELRRCVVAALVHYYRLLQRRPLSDGNGVVARMSLHQHLAQLGLHPQLWSLSRGLARRHGEYHAALSTQNAPIAGGAQRSDKALLGFIELVLDVCHEEVDYMTAALNRRRLRESVTRAYRTNPRLRKSGIRAETMPALLALLIQGALPRSEFVTFTGLLPEAASDQLCKLISIGVVVSPSSNLQRLEVGLPVWLTLDLLPDFHLA